ncbi:MAG: hypothetical protein SGPRY_010036 [Prymnesium sp.]
MLFCFTLQSAVQHATPLAFETLQRHIDDLKHVAMHGDFETRKERFEAKLAAKSELQHRALAARRHVEKMRCAAPSGVASSSSARAVR